MRMMTTSKTLRKTAGMPGREPRTERMAQMSTAANSKTMIMKMTREMRVLIA